MRRHKSVHALPSLSASGRFRPFYLYRKWFWRWTQKTPEVDYEFAVVDADDDKCESYTTLFAVVLLIVNGLPSGWLISQVDCDVSDQTLCVHSGGGRRGDKRHGNFVLR